MRKNVLPAAARSTFSKRRHFREQRKDKGTASGGQLQPLQEHLHKSATIRTANDAIRDQLQSLQEHLHKNATIRTTECPRTKKCFPLEPEAHF